MLGGNPDGRLRKANFPYRIPTPLGWTFRALEDDGEEILAYSHKSDGCRPIPDVRGKPA